VSVSWLDDVTARLPRHGRLIRALRDVVVADDRWRWFDVGCSIGAGDGDELSDIDSGIGYPEWFETVEVWPLAEQLVNTVGEVVDVLVHTMDGSPPEIRRLAVEYSDGVQLDLVVMPAKRMTGLRDREVAIVDKDGDLMGVATSQFYGPPDEDGAREWSLMAWWWLSDVAKYLQRGALFEAAERIALIRQQALKLFAAAHDVPYPSFGLTSLLDHEPFELPDGLADTYPRPDDVTSIAAAACAVRALLADCSRRAAIHLGYDLSTPWETTASERLSTATR